MAINPRRTGMIALSGLKIALFGESGAGKTFQIASLDNPIIISAEKGLLTLQMLGVDAPYIEVKSYGDLCDAYTWITDEENIGSWNTLVIDSVSEVAEVVLADYKKTNKDPRKAYSDMMDAVMDAIRGFMNIENKDMVFIFKAGRIADADTGRTTYSPYTPSDKFAAKMPYLFDEVLAIRTTKDAEGNLQRYIQTVNDGNWNCKDRSGILGAYEEADLGKLINRIKEAAHDRIEN